MASMSPEKKVEGLAEIVMSEETAAQIVQAAKTSMGMDMSDIDMVNIENFTSRLVKLAEFRRDLHGYLQDRMSTVAPNLAALIGEMVAARLISHAGSLTNLAKCPASTVQVYYTNIPFCLGSCIEYGWWFIFPCRF